jgi:type I restriction enzyme S subunit
MSTTFQKTRIGDVATVNPESLGRKFSFDKIFYVDISIVGIGTADEPQEIELKKAPSRAKRLVKNGDTILSTVRPNRRSFLYIKEPKENLVVSTGFAVVRPEKVNSRYLYYVISNQTFTDYLTQHAKGSAYPAVDAETIEKADFMLPSEKEQNTIADILGTYDDLIENNSRRIQILERIAQSVYIEWFEMNADAAMEKTDLPKGWKAENLYDVADIKMGYAFKANQFNEEQKGLRTVRIRDIPSSVATTYTTEEVDSLYIVRKGDFLIGMDGIFHMNHWQDEDALLVQRVCRVRPKNEKMRAYLALSLVKPIKHFEATLMGATVAHLGSRHLEEVFIAIPDSSFDQKLEYLNMLLDTKLQYSYQNQALRKTRDLLIPKLVTGEIIVK